MQPFTTMPTVEAVASAQALTRTLHGLLSGIMTRFPLSSSGDRVAKSSQTEGIELRDLHFAYSMPSGQLPVLQGIDLILQRGDFVCLYGSSGSGKSTLLSCIAGLEIPTSGEILVDGQPLGEMSAQQRTNLRLTTIGMVFQEHNLVSQFTASENVQLVLRSQGDRRAEISARELLAAVGIADLADRLPNHMSGGQRQRVGIARALAGNRPYLLCDEPTGALDSTNSHALFSQLRNLSKERNIGCLIATHDPLAREYANKVIEMRDGKFL